MRACWMGVAVVLVYALPVWGQQAVVFYDGFEIGNTSAWWAPALVGETGQVACYDVAGAVVGCAGTGQDGELRPGVAWPHPRFVDNGDGTVTDMLTGLVWLKDANCFGGRTWVQALADANNLASGTCGLTTHAYEAGDWRLPSRFELESLLDLNYFDPALSNAAGTAKWVEGDVFTSLSSGYYWSSTSYADFPQLAWRVYFADGLVHAVNKTTTNNHYVWPVLRK